MTGLPQTRAVIEEGIGQRLHLGAQLYVSRHGQTVADLAMGESRPGQALDRDDLMLWLSSCKPVAAIAIGRLWERGKLTLDDTVARHIPEFAARGKERVSIRHLLTHTAGFRGAAGTWTTRSWEQIIAHICGASLEAGWVPGKKAGYHVASSWFILGELVRRIDGRPYDRYVREEVFLPLGMEDAWIGMPAERVRAYGARLAPMHEVEDGDFLDDLAGNREGGLVMPRPGANGRAPARQFARIYESLLAGLRGERTGGVLGPQTVEALLARHRVGLYDHTFKHMMDWSLGFIPNNGCYSDAVAYGYGPCASLRAVGHSGAQSSVAFADPEHGLAVAIAFNGMPSEGEHQQRMRQVLGALYADLGLA